jgi:ABC-type transport system involved in multi-copper enzyme maturation permease subunit
MNARAGLSALRWLVRDTFRQGLANGIFWIMLGVTALCALGCLTATLAEKPGHGGAVTQIGPFFGLIDLPVSGGPAEAVQALRTNLTIWVAGSAGLLLVLLWTAAFLPSFLEPGAVTVLLVKPVPRWALLLGKCLGVLAFVAVQASAFVAATWLALGLRSGVWDVRYLLSVPLLLLHFTVFFSFSAMLAVATRSTVTCVLGSLLFWLLCCAVNLARHAVRSVPDLGALPGGFGRSIEVGYWALPKPLDFHILLVQGKHNELVLGQFIDVPAMAAQGAWLPEWSLAASVLSAVALFAVAAYDFVTAEY